MNLIPTFGMIVGLAFAGGISVWLHPGILMFASSVLGGAVFGYEVGACLSQPCLVCQMYAELRRRFATAKIDDSTTKDLK